MGRKIQYLTGTIRAQSALHPGAGVSSEVTDALVRRSVSGNWLLSGQALGGSLRSLATRISPLFEWDDSLAEKVICDELLPISVDEPCGCLVCRLFGDIKTSDDEERQKASRLWIKNARVLQGGSWIRDGVGMERQTGAASSRAAAKFDLEVIPAGTEFSLEVEIEPDVSDQEVAFLIAVFSEWENGRGWIGAGASRGLGALNLLDLSIKQSNWDDRESLLSWLHSENPVTIAKPVDGGVGNLIEEIRHRRRSPDLALMEGDPFRAVLGGFLEVRVALQAEGLFLSGDPVAEVASGFDHASAGLDLELETEDTGQSRLIVPGSSFRGVIRAQAERIARTIVTEKCATLAEWGERCPACDSLVKIFPDEPVQPLTACESLLAISLPDEEGKETPADFCPACRLFGSSRFGSRLRVQDAEISPDEEQPFKSLDFLATDRFTGGGKDSAKFDALAFWRPRIDLRLFLENPDKVEVGWLLLALRDLCDGLVPVGFGDAKGFGRFRGQVSFQFGRLDPDFYSGWEVGENSWEWKRSGVSDLGPEVDVPTIHGKCVDAFLQYLEEFTRGDSDFLPDLPVDHWFGVRTTMESYPKASVCLQELEKMNESG